VHPNRSLQRFAPIRCTPYPQDIARAEEIEETIITLPLSVLRDHLSSRLSRRSPFLVTRQINARIAVTGSSPFIDINHTLPGRGVRRGDFFGAHSSIFGINHTRPVAVCIRRKLAISPHHVKDPAKKPKGMQNAM
jgi:hypothetical protein